MFVESKDEEAATSTPKPLMPSSSAPGLLATPSATPPTYQHSVFKYGTRIPNRVFIGGIPPATTDMELAGFFARFGTVRQAKIIVDKGGAPKGYGFITFETDEEANAVLKEVEAEGGSLSFKERRLNIGEAVRKFPPMVPNQYESADTGPRHGVRQHQSLNHAVMPGMGPMTSSSPVDPNLPLLSQLSGPNFNDVLVAAAALGIPPAAAANANPYLYNYLYPQASPYGMEQGYPGANQGGGAVSGGWHPSSEQYYYGAQALPPVSQQSMFYPQMMYPLQAAHAVLANTPPPSDVSSWSSGNSCSSSTCSTASLGATGDVLDGSGMMAYYACVSDSNGMYYVPCNTAPSASSSSSMVPMGTASDSSQPSPSGHAMSNLNEELGEEERVYDESKTNLSMGDASNVSKDSGVPDAEASSGAYSISEAPPKPMRSLSAIIRDRRKLQQAKMDPNNNSNCQKKDSSDAEAKKETPVISVSKIFEESRSRSPSPTPLQGQEGKPMTPPVVYPSSTATGPGFLSHYQYCPPPSTTGGVPLPGAPSSPYPYPQMYHSQLQQHQPSLAYPRSHHQSSQVGYQQQQQQQQPPLIQHQPPQAQQQRSYNGWQNSGNRFRGGRQMASSPASGNSKAFPKPRKAEEPGKEPESRNVAAMVENLSIS